MKNYMVADEVLGRVQFATAFLDAFEAQLEGYEPHPDGLGAVFDLRTLPVERLRDLIRQTST